MIKRLVEEDGLDSVDRKLADLFRAAAPVAADPFRSRRVWVRLERAATRKTKVRAWLRPLAVVTLLISGTAAAALGHRYVAPRSEGPATASASMTAVEPLARARANQTLVFDRGPERADASASAVPALSTQPEPTAVGAQRIARNQTRAETSEDASKVVEAIQALRTESDPARARALLNDYLKANPRGVLSGDALALSIEAASAQHDPRASEYARRYLSSYPKGKYRELAKRALEGRR